MSIEIDSNFPGGNIVVEGIVGDEVSVHQDLRDTEHDWFYWYFRVRGAAGRTMRFKFTRSRAIGVSGPGVSLDGGVTWKWLGRDSVQDNSFAYAFSPDAAEVRFSFAMPYLESNWLRFMDDMKGNPFLSQHKLCDTAKGRHAEYARLGCLNGQPKHRVAITCRHHCCEMMVNYTLEGLIQYVATDSGAIAMELRRDVEFLLVPFVDKDGSEDGDQGKSRRPRDHGRDYEGKSIYPTTAAIRELLPAWGAGRLHLAMDLHCPWISGPHNEFIYLVGSQCERNARQQVRFAEIIESVRKGPLPFFARDYLPFGQSWNTSANYTSGKGFGRWVNDLPGMRLGAPMEIPYAIAHDAEVNQASARVFGQDLAAAIATYLNDDPGK